MNTELALDAIKTILSDSIDNTIDVIEAESGATVFLDNLQELKVGNYLPTEFTMYPSLAVQAQRSSVINDQYEWQERAINFAVVGWVIEVDNETLHRFICRLGDAIVKILRNETKWNGYQLHNQLISDATYSDVFTVSHGLAQGCQVLGSVDYILSNY
jgi:hypothetical protein